MISFLHLGYSLYKVKSPVVIIALTEVFDRNIPSKILFPFPWNLYPKADGMYKSPF